MILSSVSTTLGVDMKEKHTINVDTQCIMMYFDFIGSTLDADV